MTTFLLMVFIGILVNLKMDQCKNDLLKLLDFVIKLDRITYVGSLERTIE